MAEITPTQRMASSSIGALVTSLLMTPLDVVKTRLQIQSQTELECLSSTATHQIAVDGCPKCSHFVLNNGLMEHHVSTVVQRRMVVCDALHFKGTSDAFAQIVRTEGVGSLYNGLSPTLAMAVPATVLYFTAYDAMRARVDDSSFGVLAPAVAGSSARVLATTVVSPLELVRTIMMAETARGGATVISKVRAMMAHTGPRLLFRGLAPSLWKDVPFSAVYWLGYERAREKICSRFGAPDPSDLQYIFLASCAAGALSGSFAAFATTPLDVIKTRQQAFLFNRAAAVPTMLDTGRQITSEAAGWKGLFAGLGPRVAKVAPACAIMIGSYELGKAFFHRQNNAQVSTSTRSKPWYRPW